MAAAAGIWNHMQSAPALAGKGATPMTGPASGTSGTGSTGSSSSSTSSSATISANDFLTLLVTEMQNQDPTADTDPNEYINQLVQVNSLEQLIDINQNVSTALGDSTSSSSSSTDAVSGVAGKGSDKSVLSTEVHAAAHQGGTLAARQTAGTAATQQASGARIASGNLSVPEARPASRRVAQALSGQ